MQGAIQNPTLPQRLLIALDVDSTERAMALVRMLQPLGVGFKVGMQLFYREGVSVVHRISDAGNPVFVDLKLHDIPNTVGLAARALIAQGVSFFNVHAQGGPEMMRAAAEAAESAVGPKPLVIAVTLLTSLSETHLRDFLKASGETPASYAAHLALSAQKSGLGGVVCSAHEIARIREACGPDFTLVTPGIRPLAEDAAPRQDDQSRVMTPHAALDAGADFLVVGRPITAAPDPLAAAQAILDEMKSVRRLCSPAF